MCKRHLNIKTKDYDENYGENSKNNNYNNVDKIKKCKGIQKEVINSIKYSINEKNNKKINKKNSINYEIKNEIKNIEQNIEINMGDSINVNEQKKNLKIRVSKKPDKYNYKDYLYYNSKPTIRHFEYVEYID